MPGGSPGFDSFQAFPAPQPFYAAPPQARPTPRPVVYQQPRTQQPRPQSTRPARRAMPVERDPVALKPVLLPAPAELGIRPEEPAVVLPAPERLGIRLD